MIRLTETPPDLLPSLEVRRIARGRLRNHYVMDIERYDGLILNGDHPAEWCEAQYGPNGMEASVWSGGQMFSRLREPLVWTHIHSDFMFLRSEDAVAFKLRWA